MFPLVFVVATVLIRLLFFIILRFKYVNVQFELIVRDKFFVFADVLSFFFFFLFYKEVFYVFVCLRGCLYPCKRIYFRLFFCFCFCFCFLSLFSFLSSPLNNLRQLICYKVQLATNLPRWVIVCVFMRMYMCVSVGGLLYFSFLLNILW